jgi:hypothetical protein
VGRSVIDDVFSKDHPAPFDAGAFADRVSWEARARALRLQACVALGLHPMPQRDSPRATLGSAVRREGYSVVPLRIDGSPGVDVTATLYLPDALDTRRPAIVHAHGHHPQGRFQSGVFTHDLPLQVASSTLARMGCVVVLYDMIGYADRSAYVHRESFADQRALDSLVTEACLHTWMALRIVDWLVAQPFVDPMRVGAIGQSGGASQALFLGLVDDRPNWFFLAGMIGMAMQGGCTCENAPLLRVGTNNVELAATLAPRAVSFASANDWTKDFATLGLPELKSIYGHFDATHVIDHQHVDAPHNFNANTRAFLYDRAAATLGLTSQDESRFEPVSAEQLRVGPGTDLPPSAVVDRWTRATIASDAQRHEALRVIVGTDDTPGPSPREDDTRSALPSVWRGLHLCYNRASDARRVREQLGSGRTDWSGAWLPGIAKYDWPHLFLK